MSDQRQAEDAQTALDAVVAASRAGAQQVEEGRFRLDWQKALDKIKRFQLADPHRYVLELVPAAIASGASAIGVTTDADDVHFSFDGQPYSEEELTRLFDYLFAQDVSLVRVRQLALAVNSALGLQPKWVIVESGDGTVGHRMRLSTYKDHRVESLAGEEVPRGTRVHVRERVSWKVMGDLFRTENAEDRLLADSCLHSPVPLVLNGSDVRRPVEGLSRARRTFQHGEIRGEVLLPVDIIAGSSLDVCMGGVSIVTVTDVDGELVGPVAVRGWVDSTALSRNASHSDVHRDAHFHDCFSAVRLAVREMIGEWVDAVLLGDSDGRGQALAERKFSGTEVHYLGSAARLLLRGAGPGLLPPGLEALLDVPGLVDLAVSKPSGSSLRPLWESYRRSNRWHVASKRYDVKLGDLPPDLFPVLGPVPVLESIFPQGRQSADEPLAEIERGLYNRRQREKWRQQPRVSSADVVVARPVADEKRGIRGEIGLLRLESGPCLGTLAWMVTFGKLGAHLAPRERGVHVVFLRDGVYLGERMISAPVRHAIAVLDSPGFAASVDWDDLSPNEVFEAVEGLLAAAVPGLLEELANTVHELPPPSHLAKIGEWRPETGVVEGVPLELGAGWARDRLAGEIRWHVDAILAEHEKFDREAAPWLWAWPIFFTLDGRAVSLSELESVDGRIRYVVEQPWGRGTPRGAFVLNVSAQQQKFLRRYVPNALGAKKALLSYRKTATAEAAIRKRRELNLAVAETKRQEPRLEPLSYAAVLDLDLEEGSGQVGIPVALAGPSWVRYLFDSLPLPEEEIDTPVPVHVVVSTPLARADEAFGKQIEAEAAAAVVRAVRDSMAALVARFATSANASRPDGRALVWAYLGSLKGAKKKKQDPLAGRPDEIADFELVPTVDRGMISLRQIFEDASQHRRRVLVTELAAARQLSERPILVCGEDKRKILRRVLGVHMQDYTRELQMELAVLDRMGQRQPAVLRVGTVMKVSFDEDGMTGELGIPTQWEGKQTKGPEHWVRVMREGVALERVPLTVDRIPFVAVIDCPRFRPTSRWDSVVRDEVWKDALAVLRRVAGALVMRACSDIAGAREPNLVDPAILRALREMAGERFRGRPRLASEGDPEMEQRLADAPIWQSAAAEGGTLTLRQIGNARSDTGSVWLVGEEVGHVAPGRVIVQARDDATTAALSSIFSGTVKDGREVLRRDEEAYQRRQQAPVMQTSLDATQALASQWIESADEELGVEVRGQVALSRNYREAPRGKLNLRLAVDGRFLCESTVPHALRGLGNLDCRGLAPNRDWNGVADDKQLGFVNRVAARALWDSVEEFVRDGIAAPPGTTAREHEQAMLEEALRWLVVKPDKRPELLAQLMAAPLFTSVRGQRMSARELVAIAEDAGELLAVSAELRGGDPVDGRLVIRASEMGLRVLEDLTGAALRRHDEEWKAELRGQRRRRELPEVEPTLGEPLVEQIYFQEGDTYGVVGMQPPRTDGRYQDRDDPASLLRIHVGRRMVTERQVVWHPAVLVWINDNRFRTTPGFDDVLADDTFTAALHLVAAQIPELVARAAESCLHAPEDSLRLRICNYVLTRLDSLWEKADAEPASAAGKLLDAQLWRCLTGAGDRTLSTRQLRAANEVGRLRTVPESASGRPAASDVVVLRASEQELAWLGEAFGVLEDYSGQLERDETLRAFLARPPVEAVALSAASEAGELLHRRSLSGSGWEGEIGLRDDTGRTLSVSIYWQRRWLVTRELASPVSAAAAVQADSLLVNGAYDEVVEDPAYKAFVNRLFGELWAALDEMASGLDGAPVAGGGRIRHACVRALAGIRAKDHPLAAPPEVERSLRRAPLFVDVRGRAWSSDELEEAAGRGARVAAIAPDTATLGEPLGDQPVLVVAAGAWQDTAAVLPLERFDSAFVESIEGRKRRESAETSFRLSRRRTLVRAEVTGPEFGGEIGLGLPPADGWLALFARGRKVEKRAFPDCPGLVGSLDGAIETDHGFQHARLSGEQERAIHQLYEQRLEAAVSAAAEYSGSKRSREWKALCEYVLRYLESALAGLEGGIEERRKRLARRDQSLPPVLLAAAELPVFRLDRGGWVALTSVIGGDVADVVITSERVKHPTDTDAELLVGDPAGLRPLLCSVLGARAVHEYHAWLEGLEARAAKRAEAQRKRQETRRRRLLASVKSMLRDALDRHPADDLKRADIQRLKLEHRLGGGELTVPGGKKGKQVRLSSDHAVWQAALDAAGTNEVADQHLAAAVLADLACAAEPRLTAEELYALLACVARRGREGEQRLVATLEQIATRRTR